MSNGSEHTPERTWLLPGDRVRLTGEDWIHLGMHGQTVRVVDIDVDGDALIEDPNGGMLAVYSKFGEGDYSAERVDASLLEVPAATSSETGSDLKSGEDDPWARFTGESQADREAAELTDPLLGVINEQRSRIAALEAVIARVRSLRQVDWGMGNAGLDARSVHELLSLAPSTVLDQVIREAKAEEDAAISSKLAERNLLWWTRDQGPMVQIDEATGKKITLDQWLAERAAAYRNGDA